ncbi:hypothetical protein AoKodu_09600 [Actinomyces oris K20]|nr:hypothetical protein AoKodu_09600 [Actinomyces oris K20]
MVRVWLVGQVDLGDCWSDGQSLSGQLLVAFVDTEVAVDGNGVDLRRARQGHFGLILIAFLPMKHIMPIPALAVRLLDVQSVQASDIALRRGNGDLHLPGRHDEVLMSRPSG